LTNGTGRKADYVAGGSLHQAFWYTMLASRCFQGEASRPALPEDAQRLERHLTAKKRLFEREGDEAFIGFEDINSAHIVAVLDRRLAITGRGYLGLVPEAAGVGDLICVLGNVRRLWCCDYVAGTLTVRRTMGDGGTGLGDMVTFMGYVMETGDVGTGLRRASISISLGIDFREISVFWRVPIS
jgi:hypothetical protein